jgi:hypothetical protein
MARIIIIDDEGQRTDLEPSQVDTVINALRVAADRFGEDMAAFAQEAARLRALPPEKDSEPKFDEQGRKLIRVQLITSASALAMRDQFRFQRRNTRQVLALVEGYADDPDFDSDELSSEEEELFSGEMGKGEEEPREASGTTDPGRERFGSD